MAVRSEWVYEHGGMVLRRVWVDGVEVPLTDVEVVEGHVVPIGREVAEDDGQQDLFADPT